MPDTYRFPRGYDRQALVGIMQGYMQTYLKEAWKARASDLPIKTPEEALILASIIEKETGDVEEQPIVASVSYNRLSIGMRLQSCPTVIYGLVQGARFGRTLTYKDLESDTPYNTYIINGLPPTPITNPGRSALKAAMNPADSEYFYFVVNQTGGHAFAKTLREHNRNVAKWRSTRVYLRQ